MLGTSLCSVRAFISLTFTAATQDKCRTFSSLVLEHLMCSVYNNEDVLHIVSCSV